MALGLYNVFASASGQISIFMSEDKDVAMYLYNVFAAASGQVSIVCPRTRMLLRLRPSLV